MKDSRKRCAELAGLVRTAFHAGTAFDTFVNICFNGTLVFTEMNGVCGADFNAFSTRKTSVRAGGAGGGTGCQLFVGEIAFYRQFSDRVSGSLQFFPFSRLFFQTHGPVANHLHPDVRQQWEVPVY